MNVFMEVFIKSPIIKGTVSSILQKGKSATRKDCAPLSPTVISIYHLSTIVKYFIHSLYVVSALHVIDKTFVYTLGILYQYLHNESNSVIVTVDKFPCSFVSKV